MPWSWNKCLLPPRHQYPVSFEYCPKSPTSHRVQWSLSSSSVSLMSGHAPSHAPCHALPECEYEHGEQGQQAGGRHQPQHRHHHPGLGGLSLAQDNMLPAWPCHTLPYVRFWGDGLRQHCVHHWKTDFAVIEVGLAAELSWEAVLGNIQHPWGRWRSGCWVLGGVGWNEVTFIFFIYIQWSDLVVGGVEVDLTIHLWDRKW